MRSSSSIDDLFVDLPEVGLKVNSFPSSFSQQIAANTILELGRGVRDISYLMSSDPEVVLKACKDLLMNGTSVETIFRCGGWLDTALPIFLKWSTRDPQIKHRRVGRMTLSICHLIDSLLLITPSRESFYSYIVSENPAALLL